MLAEAARRGDVAKLRALLASGAPVDPEPAGKDSPLCLAVMFGQLDAARALLDAGANVNHAGSYGRTPLHYAARAGVAATELCLAHGADLRARNEGDEDVLGDLITDDGADAAVVRVLLAAGFDLSARPTRSYRGRSHLMWACFCGRLPIVEVLLAAGVDPNERAPDGSTAFSQTMSGMTRRTNTHHRLVAALVRAGLAPDARTSFGDSNALLECCRAGDLELVRLLLERGADPNVRLDGTPLTAAQESGNPALIDLLLERGAKPERAPLEASPQRHALEDAARAHPEAPAHRLAWARELAASGARAAAVHELDAVARLGGEVPAELRASLDLENPPGTRWTLEVEPGPEVAGFVDDARFPRATVRSGARALPLSVVLGKPCTRCDDDAMIVCSQCDGSGTRPGFLNPDHDYPCPTRELCTTCCGTKFVVDGPRFGPGPCKHGKRVREFDEAGVRLSRCPLCGLATLRTDAMETQACGVCGRFACTCRG